MKAGRQYNSRCFSRDSLTRGLGGVEPPSQHLDEGREGILPRLLQRKGALPQPHADAPILDGGPQQPRPPLGHAAALRDDGRLRDVVECLVQDWHTP